MGDINVNATVSGFEDLVVEFQISVHLGTQYFRVLNPKPAQFKVSIGCFYEKFISIQNKERGSSYAWFEELQGDTIKIVMPRQEASDESPLMH